ncbi:hypothetical protein [Aquimarina agarilytica]|uniref:hypothetical protein n=1 Tax=Aquimarina agarilytica TaxID=1087449 RepID=UPI00030BFB73|nr:hypothetical protein [Aquimarina agarilytica]
MKFKCILQKVFFLSYLLSFLFISCEKENSNVSKEPLSKNIIAGVLTCPETHPFMACDQCWTNSQSSIEQGCKEISENTSSENNDANEDTSTEDNTTSEDTNSENNDAINTINTPNDLNNSTESFICGNLIYNPKNNICNNHSTPSNLGCFNSDGLFISSKGVVSNPCNTKEAILDIERNLGINIDDEFIELCGYQGAVPPINPSITRSDFIVYIKKLFEGITIEGKTGDQYAIEFAKLLDTNNDGILTRNEASQSKGSDPRQVLNLEPIFTINGGLATDDLLAYVGLYLGDGALDKYAGDLPDIVQKNMTHFTRTWQPGVNAASKRYNEISK